MLGCQHLCHLLIGRVAAKSFVNPALPSRGASRRRICSCSWRLPIAKMLNVRFAGDTAAKAICAQKRAENGLLAALNRAFVFTNRYIAMPDRTDSIQVAG